jgi:hypothetical protein
MSVPRLWLGPAGETNRFPHVPPSRVAGEASRFPRQDAPSPAYGTDTVP